jgi:hypothetical protein
MPLLGPASIDDAPGKNRETPLLLVAQARPEGLGSVSEPGVRGAARGVGLPVSTQPVDEIGWCASLLIILPDLILDLRPLTGGGLHRRPKLFLIRSQTKTRADGRQTGVQESRSIILGKMASGFPTPRPSIRPMLLSARRGHHETKTEDQDGGRDGASHASSH